MTKALIEHVRKQVARVRQRLLCPSVETLEAGVTELEQVVGELRTRPKEARDGPAAQPSVRQLRHELLQVHALARQAKEFYAAQISVLAEPDSALRYDENGGTGRSLPETIPGQTPVLHG